MIVTVNVAYPGDRSVDREGEMFVIRTDRMVLWCPQACGPNPLSLVLSSLGMCSGEELYVFCDRRGIPTDDVRLAVSAELSEESHRVEEIRVQLRLPSAFPEEYIEAVQRAVAHCSVKKHLEAPLPVQVSIDETQTEGATSS